jgi:hypothetical protein
MKGFSMRISFFPRNKWRRRLLMVIGAIPIIAALDMLFVQLRRHIAISQETTALTTLLSPDGTPDYLAAINARQSQGVTRENNAAIPLLDIFGTADKPAWWRERALPVLGLSAGGSPPKIVDFQDWVMTLPSVVGGWTPSGKGESVEDPPWMQEPWKMPWKSAEHPMWMEWIGGQKESLAAAREALTREKFYVPLVSDESGSRAMLTADFYSANFIYAKERALADLLLADAQLQAGDGNWPSFEEDVVAAMRLAGHVGKEAWVIDFFVSIALDTRASQAVSAAATQPGMQAGVARRVLAIMDASDAVARPDRAMDTSSRWETLNELVYGATFGSEALQRRWEWDRLIELNHESQPMPAKTMQRTLEGLLIPVNYNRALRETNELMDQLVAALRLPRFRERLDAAKAIKKAIEPYEEAESLLRNAHPARSIVGPVARSAASSVILGERTVVSRDLARVALALRAYRDEKGVFPENLKVLQAAGILKEVPVDGFSDAPLIYRREEDGYVVYSVGEDGKDDGGHDPAAQKRRLEDIVVRSRH